VQGIGDSLWKSDSYSELQVIAITIVSDITELINQLDSMNGAIFLA